MTHKGIRNVIRHVALLLTLLVNGLFLSGCQEHEAVLPKGEMNGDQLFTMHCSGCHAEGGNLMNPEKPLKGSVKLASFETFQDFIQNPGQGMPPFDEKTVPAADAKKLYDAIQAQYGKP
jgi:mono/diheme cytochrome c family protein